jgi:hypothetical protein
MAMEELLREIITPPSPCSPATSLPDEILPPSAQTTAGVATTTSAPMMTMDWEKELEMQRLLDAITGAQPEVEEIDFSSALELELGEWELPPSEIGVF